MDERRSDSGIREDSPVVLQTDPFGGREAVPAEEREPAGVEKRYERECAEEQDRRGDVQIGDAPRRARRVDAAGLGRARAPAEPSSRPTPRPPGRVAAG